MSTLNVSNLQSSGGGGVAASLASINGGPLAGFRNAIINGNFDIWQYSTSQTIGTTINTRYFTADRWFNFFDGTGATRTVSRQAFTIGQSDVPNNPKYFYRLAKTVADTGATYDLLTQRIESVYTLAGQQITVSFWAKAASALTMIANVAQGFGFASGGSANTIAFTSSSLNVTTTWQKFTVTGTVPSISGKTLGTAGDDNLTFQFGLPINTTFTIDIAQVQLEAGPVATPFERRPIGTELALCQRYYYASSTQSSNGTAYGISLGSFGYRPLATGATGNNPRNFFFPVQMRTLPTITLSQFGWHPTATVNTSDTLPNTVSPGSVVVSAYNDGLSFVNEYTTSAVINMYVWGLTASAEL
jgi:hypothetical protein